MVNSCPLEKGKDVSNKRCYELSASTKKNSKILKFLPKKILLKLRQSSLPGHYRENFIIMKGLLRVSNQTIVKQRLNFYINFDFALDCRNDTSYSYNLSVRKTQLARQLQNRENRNENRQRQQPDQNAEQKKKKQSDVAVVCTIILKAS